MTNFNRHMVGDSCNAGAGTTGDGHECKKKVLVGNVGSGAEELDRLIVDDQNQIDEGRMISIRALPLQTIEVNRLRALGKLQQRSKKR